MAWIMFRRRLINLDHVAEIKWERHGEGCYRIRAWSITGEKVLDEYIDVEWIEKLIQVLADVTKATPIDERRDG